MREILFRGKSINTGEWVSGMNIFFACNHERTSFGALITPSGTHIDHSVVDGNRMQHLYDSVEVDVETVGQFTGHVDKNGKKIFEGDIIDMTGEWWDACGPAGHDSPICAVKFDPFTGGFEPFASYDCDCGVYINAAGCEVIGNIYDNPELLKGGGEDG